MRLRRTERPLGYTCPGGCNRAALRFRSCCCRAKRSRGGPAMRVLIHLRAPRSPFVLRALLSRIEAGLRAAGHDVEIADPPGRGFKPRFSAFRRRLLRRRVPCRRRCSSGCSLAERVLAAAGGPSAGDRGAAGCGDEACARWRDWSTPAAEGRAARAGAGPAADGLVVIAPSTGSGSRRFSRDGWERVFTHGFPTG